MHKLLQLLLLLLACGLCASAQRVDSISNPNNVTVNRGGYQAARAAWAPGVKYVYPGKDSAGQFAVVGGLWWYHDGEEWVTPAGAAEFDSTYIYRALADSCDSLRVLIDGMGGGSTDTTGLSARIDQCVKYPDTLTRIETWSHAASVYITPAAVRVIAHDTADAVRALIPTNNSTLTNGAGYTTSVVVRSIVNDTANAIRALIPTNNSSLANGAGYTTSVAVRAIVGDTAAALRSAITPPATGGTGIANNAASTITISGNFGTTLTVTGTTAVTLPTTGTLATRAGAETLTNKRYTPRVVSAASYTTSTTIDADVTDVYVISAQAGALLFNAPSGTPTEAQQLVIRIKDNGTARALTYNAIFRASSDLALPTTTVLGKTMYMGLVYNLTDTKWDLVSVLNNF